MNARLPMVIGALALALAAAPAGAAAREDSDPARFVDPFVGTARGAPGFATGGGAGATFPGAVVPFGMVQLSPDTSPGTDNFAGGYSYRDRRLRGFGLTHFSGAGCAVFQDVPILPTPLRLTGSPVDAGSSDLDERYLPAFAHNREWASPGSYRVILSPGTPRRVAVDLTATTRTGAARFQFPATRTATVLFNAGGSAKANGEAAVRIDPARREVDGMAESGRFCHQADSYRVYFAARFDRPFRAYGTWRRQALRPRSRRSSDRSSVPIRLARVPVPASVARARDSRGTAQAGAYATFDARRRRTVEVRIGVSFTSVAEARRNLRAEASWRSFGALRARARASWNAALRRLTVAGGSRTNLRLFYTALYHALLHPNVVGDADGAYRGMDGRRHRDRGRVAYANVSGWDVYRGEQQLIAMLFPRRAGDMAQSLVAAARESGCLPRWSVVNGQTSEMVGDPSDALLASTYAFGVRAFDARGALAAMVRGATRVCHTSNGDYTEREGLADYLRQGYIGYEHNVASAAHTAVHSRPWGTAATTLEYATADFAISRLAAALGDRRTADAFLARSGNWRTLLNPATRTVEPRYSGGRWVPGYDPRRGGGFVEGSAAQYTWAVPYDPSGLSGALGGPGAARRRLDRFFGHLNSGPRAASAYLGNEPSLGAPWLYDWLGAPYRTQAVMRRALTSLYRLAPGGMPGNDDGGTLSAWWVLGAIGLYPAVPGEDVLAVGSPLFRRATLLTSRGRVTIEAPAAGSGRPYVHSMRMGERTWTRPWLRFGEIADGASIAFDLAARPDVAWGADRRDAPPSFAPAAVATPARVGAR